MVQHYALKPKASIRPYLLKTLYKSMWTEVQRFKGIVSDHGSTALAVTYIGYGIKIPTNLGLDMYPALLHTVQIG